MKTKKVHRRGEVVGVVERGRKVYAPACGAHATSRWVDVATRASAVTCRRNGCRRDSL